MTLSPSAPPLNTRGYPLHKYTILPNSQRPYRDHLYSVAQGIQTAFLGPMPAKQFISEFLPLNTPEKEVLPVFKEGFFDEVIQQLGKKAGKREKNMYDPFCAKISTILSNLTILNTSSKPDNTTSDYSFSIKPDCGVYRKESKETNGTVASAEFLIEFKWSREDDPFYLSQAKQSAGQSENPTKKNSLLSMPLNQSSAAYHTLGQIGTYVAVQTDSQYRTHVFFILIIGEYARLMRWDRSGVIFTDRIDYNKQSELVEFFERYDAAVPKVRGNDELVGQPDPKELEDALQAGFREPLLAVSIPNPNGIRKRYIIQTPSARPSLPVGRSTRTSIAYDAERQKRVFMKDSWPVFERDDMMEGRVYQRLNRGRVPNTPHCVAFSNVDDDNYDTRTQHYTCESWVLENLEFSVPMRRHHRLILDVVGKPLDKFASSKELVGAVRAAIIAHKEAYLLGFLHRDVSSGNILITDDERYDGGLLIDWDLCKAKGTQEAGDLRASRTGTWQFMSAELLKFPRTPHSFVHDLESAYFVLLAYGIRNMKHTMPDDEVASMVHDVLDSRRYGSGGGLPKYHFMRLSSSMNDYEIPSNEPFTTLLGKLHIKHSTRYTHLDKRVSAEELANLQPSFLTLEALMANDYNHDVFIGIMDTALNSDGWPTNDGAFPRSILRPNSSVARALSSSKRSRSLYGSGSDVGASDRSSKRLNLGAAV